MNNTLKSALDKVSKPAAKIVGSLVLTAVLLSGCGAEDNDNDSYIPSVIEIPDNGSSNASDAVGGTISEFPDPNLNDPLDELGDNNNIPAENESSSNAFEPNISKIHHIDTDSVEGAAVVEFARNWLIEHNIESGVITRTPGGGEGRFEVAGIIPGAAPGAAGMSIVFIQVTPSGAVEVIVENIIHP